MPAGRPLKFQSVEELDKMISAYFENTPRDEWTWTGLALYLDTDKWTLTQYADRPEFTASIKNALLKVENGYEIDLKKHGRTGTIFALKNFDWKDKSEVENSGGQTLTFTWENNAGSYTLPPANTFPVVAQQQQTLESSSSTPEKRKDGGDNQPSDTGRTATA